MAKDRLEYDNGVTRVVLTDTKFRCTKCNKWKMASKFGLRDMSHDRDDVTYIRQIPQCKECRNNRSLS